jgi:hypothetical protein
MELFSLEILPINIFLKIGFKQLTKMFHMSNRLYYL